MEESGKIVFVDQNGVPTGEVGLASHAANTKLHLAFSCYIFRRIDNKILVTRRALSKKIYPGVWSNSLCGHPAPGEIMEDTIRRLAKYELGIYKLENISVVLPHYQYSAPPYEDVIENEFCPVYIAYALDDAQPNPNEVDECLWLEWSEYVTMLHADAEHMSYWAKDQYLQLKDAEPFASLVAPL